MRDIPRTPWGQVAVAALAFAVFEAVVRLTPSLASMSVFAVVTREFLLIVSSLLLLTLILRVGQISVSDIGWARPGIGTIGWGLACAVALIVLSATAAAAFQAVGVRQNESVLAGLASKPAWLLPLIALGAAISEEIIFRGIVLNCMAKAGGHRWVGAIVSLALFALAHVSGWGWTQALLAGVPGLVLTLFYIWKRNLGACIVAHFLTDLLGLLGAAHMHHG